MKLLEARQLADELMDMHLGVDRLWTFEFDQAKRRFGRTNYTKRRISLSKHLVQLNDEVHVMDTILHEIAHVLVGAGYGHGRVWRNKAIEIGCNGSTYYSQEVIKPVKTWTGRCNTCATEIARHRRSKSACYRCCKNYNQGYYSDKYLLTWERN